MYIVPTLNFLMCYYSFHQIILSHLILQFIFRTKMEHVSNQSVSFSTKILRDKWLWPIQGMFWFMISTKLISLILMVRNNEYGSKIFTNVVLRVVHHVMSISLALLLSFIVAFHSLFPSNSTQVHVISGVTCLLHTYCLSFLFQFVTYLTVGPS